MTLLRYAERFDPVTADMLFEVLGLCGTPPPLLSTCARRVAEILVREGLDGQAADWWRWAARLGDPTPWSTSRSSSIPSARIDHRARQNCPGSGELAPLSGHR